MSDVLPDLGLHLHTHGNRDATVTWLEFPIPNLSRVEPDKFCTNVTLPYDDGRVFALTVDFDRKHVNSILETFPKALAGKIRAIIDQPFNDPATLNLPQGLSVALDARLGQLVTLDTEQFVPLVATRVSPVAG